MEENKVGKVESIDLFLKREIFFEERWEEKFQTWKSKILKYIGFIFRFFKAAQKTSRVG